MRRLGVCLVVVGGCGRLAFDPRGDASNTPDADLGPFGTPTPVAVINSGLAGIHDDDPSLTGDMLEIYFNSNRSGGGEILRSTRAQITDAWSTPQAVTELNSTGTENTPFVMLDGLTIYFSSNRSVTQDIFVSTRATRTDTWSVPALVPELSGPDAELGITVSPDGLTAYLTSDSSTAPGIHRATRTTTAMPWSAPSLVTELAATGQDSDPFVTADDRVIYWSSSRGGNLDIWTAARPAPGQPFAQTAIVPELMTTDEEEDPWISPDGHTLYFTRGPSSTKVIYMATR